MATPLADRLLSREIAAELPALLEPCAGASLAATRAAAAAIDGQALSARAGLLRDGLLGQRGPPRPGGGRAAAGHRLK
ncbi:MAG: hypothetical protein GXY03_02125 [Solirubrobacterales bacterium]|nr:hypothetical protein [Solirubrobacterales bacterium]